jgi:transposase
MTQPAATLPNDIDTAHRQIREQAETLRQQAQLIAKLQHQLEQLLRQRYGQKSEKVDPAQLLLFAHEILAQTEPTPPQTPSTESAAAKPKGHGRKPLPASLPRKRIVHDVALEDRACPECGEERRKIGEEVREQLEYVPASLLVLQHVRPKYACKSCQAHVVIAPRLPEPIEKGVPGTGLLAHLIVSKFLDHLPLYRLEGILRRWGVELSRSTMCDWLATCAFLLAPIVNRMGDEIGKSDIIQTDDTTVPVQDKSRDKTKTGRLWAYLGDQNHRYIVYDYTPDRSRDGPEAFLKNYTSGYLQSDAYAGYNRLHNRGLIEVGCWAHARRKFYEARTSDPVRSHAALAWIGLLYDVERSAKDQELSDDQRLSRRLEKSRPILESLASWLETERTNVLPKSPMGEAISYARSNWIALNRYLESGALEIDNNASERALRTVALGRKNWLFAGSDAGGKTAATLISLCMTCKTLGVEPWAYLRDVLDRVSTHPNSRIEELLPDRWKPAESTDPSGRKA